MKRNKNILFIVSFIIILLLAILIFFIMNKEETRAFSSRHENAHFYAQPCAEEICR